jgi:hypothetical protein
MKPQSLTLVIHKKYVEAMLHGRSHAVKVSVGIEGDDESGSGKEWYTFGPVYPSVEEAVKAVHEWADGVEETLDWRVPKGDDALSHLRAAMRPMTRQEVLAKPRKTRQGVGRSLKIADGTIVVASTTLGEEITLTATGSAGKSLTLKMHVDSARKLAAYLKLAANESER